METVAESRCCREIEQVAATMEAGVHSYIRDHSWSRSDWMFWCCESPTWHTRSNVVTCSKIETGTEICTALLCWATHRNKPLFDGDSRKMRQELSGKGQSCPPASLCCHQDTRRVSIARLWRISLGARVLELLGIILWLWSGSYGPW